MTPHTHHAGAPHGVRKIDKIFAENEFFSDFCDFFNDTADHDDVTSTPLHARNEEGHTTMGAY